MAAGSATQSTLGNTSNLKGKLSSLEVSYNLIRDMKSFGLIILTFLHLYRT